MTANPRALLRHVKRWTERQLHPWRRRRALEALGRAAPIRSVLVVCLGNICRSPYAQASLRRMLGKDQASPISIHSAGFIGPGRSSPEYAVLAADKLGLDLRRHVSQVLTPDIVESADLIVVMTAAQARDMHRDFAPRSTVLILGDVDPQMPVSRDILDPFEGPVVMFEEVYTRIDRCTAALGALLAGNRSQNGSGD